MTYDNAIVLAGGLGTRLREAVPDVPKVLAPVAGRPFLAHLLAHLASGGVRECILATGYRADAVERALGDRFDAIALRYSREERPLGTGGAVVRALREHNSPAPLWVVNGDSYLAADLPALALAHEANTADVTLALARVPDAARYGRVELAARHTAGGALVDAFREKGAPGPGLVNAGLYLLNPAALQRVDLPEAFSLEVDFFARYLDDLRLIGAEQDGYFVDIGVPADHARAEAYFSGAAPGGAPPGSRGVPTAPP